VGILASQSTLKIAVWTSVLIHTAGFLGFELAFSNKRDSFPKSEPRAVTLVSISTVSSSVPPQDIIIPISVQNEVLEENPLEETIQENKVLPDVLEKETSSSEIISNNITTSKQEKEMPLPTMIVNSDQGVVVEEVILVTEPVPLNIIEPKYPFRARKKGLEGIVILYVTISKSGEPLLCNIADSSGYKDLDNAAKKSVLSSLFQPGTSNGEDIESTLRISISFLLNKS
jgi:TonB family protein